MPRISSLRPLFARAFLLYGASGVNFILGFLFIPIAMRRLGADGYGLLSVYLFGIGSFLYLDQAFSKVFVKIYKEQGPDNATAARSVFGGLIVVAVFCVIIALVVVLGWIVFQYAALGNVSGRDGAFSFLIMAFVVDYVLGLPITYFTTRSIANNQTEAYGKFLWLQNGLRFFALFVAVLLTSNPVLIAAGVTIRRALDYLIVYSMFYRQSDFRNLRSPSFDLAIAKLKENSAIFVAHFTHILAFESVSMLSAFAFGVRGFGLYRAGFDAINRIWFVTSVFPLLIFPSAVGNATAFKSGPMRERMIYGLHASWLIYALISLGFTLFGARFVVRMIPELASHTSLLAFMFLGICCNGHARLALEFLQGFNLSKLCTRINLITLALVIAMTLGLKDSFGIVSLGFAWAFCFSLHAMYLDWVLLHEIGTTLSRRFFSLLFGIVLIMLNAVVVFYTLGT